MSLIARPATAPTNDKFVHIDGQSLASDMDIFNSWRACWYTLIGNATATNPGKKVSATGGSSILKKFQRLDVPNLYWYDEDTNSDGPLLTTAKASIAAMATKPAFLIWVQGEQDGDQMTLESDRVLYEAGLTYVIDQLRREISAVNYNGVRTIISVLGRRESVGDYPGWSMVRKSQLNLIASGVNIRGPEKYDIDLRDSVHGASTGYPNMGWRIGDAASALDQVITGGSTTIASGPAIDTVNVAVVGNTIEIPITVEASHTLSKPTSPTGFGFVNGGGALVVPTGYSWVGDTLVATFASSPSGLTVEYPYRNLPGFVKANVIRYNSAVGAPSAIASGLNGKPLKSILPISL